MSRPILAWHFLRDDRTLKFEHNKRENVKVLRRFRPSILLWRESQMK